jgi:type II secretory pathway component PulJ
MRYLAARLSLVRRESERGISIAELLVAVTLFALLLTMTSGFMVSAYRAAASSRAIDTATRQATNGMTEMSRMIRAASEYQRVSGAAAEPAIIVAEPSRLQLYAFVNLEDAIEKPVKVEFKIDGTKLVETRWDSTASPSNPDLFSFATSPSSTRVLADPVLSTTSTGARLFTYLGSARASVPLNAASAVADVTSVANITVSLQAGLSTSPSNSTLLVNTIGLTNLTSGGTP